MIKEIPSNEDHEADTPVSSAMDGRKKRKGDSSRKQKPAISATKRLVSTRNLLKFGFSTL
nr:uncharacterized protein LOC109163184 [Ipomoea batatas]